MQPRRPVVLFACVHNAGRSQMAAAFMRRYAAGRIEVLSGGSEPAEAIHPSVLEAMSEIGVDLRGVRPRAWSGSDFESADVVVTMGCGEACPYYPAKRYLNWEIPDPKDKSIEEVRAIRDRIDQLVASLARELLAKEPAFLALGRTQGGKG